MSLQRNSSGALMRAASGGGVLSATTDNSCCCGGTTGPGPNCSCGCASCAEGGITACNGGQAWPADVDLTLSFTPLVVNYDAAFINNNGDLTRAFITSVSSFDADGTLGKINISGSYSLTGSSTISLSTSAGCGVSVLGYYRKWVASDDTSYEFDAMGGLPRITHSVTATLNQQSTYAGNYPVDYVKVINGGEVCTTSVGVDSTGTGSIELGCVPDSALRIKPSQTGWFENSFSEGYETGSYSFGNGRAWLTALVLHSGSTGAINAIGNGIDSTDGNLCDGDLSLATTVTATTASASTPMTDGIVVVRTLTGGRHPSGVIQATVTATGTESQTTPANPGCKDCHRAFHVTIAQDDGTVVYDQTLVQNCSSQNDVTGLPAPGGAWPYACQWGTGSTAMQRLGPAFWTIGTFNARGTGDCPTSIVEIEPQVELTSTLGGGLGVTGLIVHPYTLTITEVDPPADLCCACDEGNDPDICGDCQPCADSPTAVNVVWRYGAGDDRDYGAVSLTSPCTYGDGGDTPITLVGSNYEITVFDEDAEASFTYRKHCGASGPLGTYTPIDGGSGTIEVT